MLEQNEANSLAKGCAIKYKMLLVQQSATAALKDAAAAKARLHEIAAEVEAAQSRLDSLRA